MWESLAVGWDVGCTLLISRLNVTSLRISECAELRHGNRTSTRVVSTRFNVATADAGRAFANNWTTWPPLGNRG